MKYDDRLLKLRNRRSDEQFIRKSFTAESAARILNENYAELKYPESVKYTIGAMAEVDKAYTDNTVKEGERIKEQLKLLRNDGHNFSFKYQGSTSNNTHIKVYSDIDLLVIQEKFIFTSSAGSSYSGNWKMDQVSLRESCVHKLKEVFYTATVDTTGTFSIKITGGSLKRKIDVVPSCWDLDERYNSNQIEEYKGIRVYDKMCEEFNRNFPFINNMLIDQKDNRCGGNFRNAIRLLKTLKADSSRELKISSYDITSVLYYMPDANYLIGNQYLLLVKNIKDYLLSLCSNTSYYSSLVVPDKTRKICDKTAVEDVKGIAVEVGELENDLVQDLSKVYKNLNEKLTITRRLVS